MILLAALALAAAPVIEAGPLERCDPPPGWDKVAARNTRFVVFGEVHGTNEAPAFVGDVACALAFQGERLLVAIELDTGVNAALQAAWAQPDDRFPAALRRIWPAGRNDGVGSEAMLALLLRLHRLRTGGRAIDVVAFNGNVTQERTGPFASLPGQGQHEAAQVENIRAADAGRYDHVLVLTGNLHARKQPVTRGGVTFEPMAMRLAPAAAVTSLAMRTAGGTTWSCQLKPGCTFTPGRPLPEGAMSCAGHAIAASGTLAGPAGIGLGNAPGTTPDTAYDGYFWLGRVTASPPAKP